jgi:hypothetical protein
MLNPMIAEKNSQVNASFSEITFCFSASATEGPVCDFHPDVRRPSRLPPNWKPFPVRPPSSLRQL